MDAGDLPKRQQITFLKLISVKVYDALSTPIFTQMKNYTQKLKQFLVSIM